jgi:hypothetical protein
MLSRMPRISRETKPRTRNTSSPDNAPNCFRLRRGSDFRLMWIVSSFLGGRMTLASKLRCFVKMVLPGAVQRHILARRNARRFYKRYFGPHVSTILPTLLATGEMHNFTFDITERNIKYLRETIACVTQRPSAEIAGYIEEALNDRDLKNSATKGALFPRPNLQSPFGRRLGWYAIARAMKPRIVVETGVERGHGALILCAALLRNAAEGNPGRYCGTDIDPNAGRLLVGKYAEIGKILYGDSITSLEGLNEKIDLFINDSDHSADYEYREYQTIAGKLNAKAIILGDNAHVTDKLALFSEENGRQFLFFREDPKDHWYPGGGIGISFPKSSS